MEQTHCQPSPPASLEWRLQQELQDHFRLKSFRKGQLAILRSICQGHDTMAVMPTGGGKSLCYQLPALLEEGLVVVISPLISLMKDQVRGLRALGLPAGCFYAQQGASEKIEIFAAIKQGGPFVLYLSPERVQHPGFATWIQTQRVVLFAIDEAHCVSQWGPDFREDYHKLSLLRELRPEVPILALTATATPLVLDDIGRQLRLGQPDCHVYGFYRPNLFVQVESCVDDQSKFAFLMQALQQTQQGKALIYCGTRQQTETLALALEPHFAGVGHYHAGLETEKRKAVQEQMDRGEIRILAATNAFGMGIDFPDVRLVVHYQMPANMESYYQEIGRAGRDGERSTCLLLYSRKDRGLQAFFISKSKAEDSVIRRRWRALDAITDYLEGGECRHAGILTYFRDTDRITNCGHCDVCAPKAPDRIPKPAPPTKVITKKARKDELTLELTSPDAEVRALVLREWRKGYAKINDIPAFMVFSNRTLTELANKDPKDLLELARIYGFGSVKVDTIGALVLEELGKCRK